MRSQIAVRKATNDTYLSPEHFAKLYRHADAARWPNDGPFETADWWRAMLVTAYMTGWRIGSLLALREDVDLETGFALSRAAERTGFSGPLRSSKLLVARASHGERHSWNESTSVFSAIIF